MSDQFKEMRIYSVEAIPLSTFWDQPTFRQNLMLEVRDLTDPDRPGQRRRMSVCHTCPGLIQCRGKQAWLCEHDAIQLYLEIDLWEKAVVPEGCTRIMETMVMGQTQ